MPGSRANSASHRRRSRAVQPATRQARAAAQAIAEAETMLCCAHCAIYYPASENVRSDGRDYCSTAHAGLPAA